MDYILFAHFSLNAHHANHCLQKLRNENSKFRTDLQELRARFYWLVIDIVDHNVQRQIAEHQYSNNILIASRCSSSQCKLVDGYLTLCFIGCCFGCNFDFNKLYFMPKIVSELQLSSIGCFIEI